MSNTTDEYTLRLVDQILSPLNGIYKMAEKVNGTMERMEKMASGGLGLAKLAGGVGIAVGALGVLSTAMGGIISLMEKGAEGVLGFGRAVISAAGFREKFRGMLQHQLGESAGAHAYTKVMDIADLTPGTAAASMENASRLVNIGLRGNTLDAALAGSMDIQAMFGEEKAAMFTRGITDMFSKSKFEVQDFKQAVSGIIPAELAEAAILRLKGISVSADKVSETFEKLKKSGSITGKEGALGTMIALEENIDKGKGLGAYARKRGSGSLEGLMSNLEEAPANFLRRMDFEKMPGMEALKGFITRVLAFFKEGTEEGNRLKSVVERMTNVLFGGLTKITDKDLGRFFEAAVKAAGELVKVVESAWGWMDKLLHGDSGEFLAATGKVLFDVGMSIGKGIWAGLWAVNESDADKAKAKRGGLTEGQYGAAGKELGEMARRADDLSTIFNRAGGKQNSPAFRATVEYLDQQDGLSESLRSQVDAAREKLGLDAPKTALQGTVEAIDTSELDTLVDRGKEIPQAVRKGMDEASERHSPPRVFVEAGEEYVDAMLIGIRRRMDRIKVGDAEVDPLLDQLIEVLRGSAHRTGAPAR